MKRTYATPKAEILTAAIDVFTSIAVSDGVYNGQDAQNSCSWKDLFG